jgi:hypothetical protein
LFGVNRCPFNSTSGSVSLYFCLKAEGAYRFRQTRSDGCHSNDNGDFSDRRDNLTGRAMEESRNYSPMPLGRRREPFDHPEWIFELK